MITPKELVELLKSKGLKCSFAESLTGGMVSCGIVDIPGASVVFDGSIISYSDRVKIKVLGVPSAIIEEKTAVSKECAIAMARGAYRLTGADIAVSVTGYAGPGDGEDGTPCGTVYVGWCDKFDNNAIKCHFSGDRDSVRKQTRDKAYDIISERAVLQ